MRRNKAAFLFILLGALTALVTGVILLPSSFDKIKSNLSAADPDASDSRGFKQGSDKVPETPPGGGYLALTLNGQTIGGVPRDIKPGSTVEQAAGECSPNRAAETGLHSGPISLGSATADASGVVRTTVIMPEASAGVHTITIEGEGAGGVAVAQEIRVRYPGRPVGGSGYATYFCCFESITDDYDPEELVDMNYGGMDYGAIRPEDNGGVLVSVPVIDPLDVRTSRSPSPAS